MFSIIELFIRFDEGRPLHKWIQVSDEETLMQVKIYGQTLAEEEAKKLGKIKKSVNFSFANPDQFNKDEIVIFPQK